MQLPRRVLIISAIISDDVRHDDRRYFTQAVHHRAASPKEGAIPEARRRFRRGEELSFVY